MNLIQQTIEELVHKYNYAKLSSEESAAYRRLYYENLPSWAKETKKYSLKTVLETPIAISYSRIVVGDYGAYVEIDPCYIIKDSLICKPGQEYRFYNDLGNVKYYWLTTKDDSGIKIYLQKREVSYAGYIPGMFYVSPYEVLI